MPWKEWSRSGAGRRRTAGCTLQRYETATQCATAPGLPPAPSSPGIGVASQECISVCFCCCRGRTDASAGGEGLDMLLEPVEPAVRRVVAERLGVGQEELAPEVSLADELAVDSLDMVEVGLALEDEFGIAVPDHVLEEVRTYQHL